MMTLPTFDDLAVLRIPLDDGGSVIAVVDQRLDDHEPPLLELAPMDALGIAADIIGAARNALTEQPASAEPDEPDPPALVIDDAGDFGQVLRRLRTEKHLSCAYIARRLECTDGAVSMAETGKRMPRLPQLMAILRILGYRLAVVKR